MAEYAGYGYFAEVPGVIFDVQRAGPSTGLPTRTMQGDVAFAYTLSHGDTKHIVLLPATVREAYEFAMEAFDLAERFQTPVFVLSDLDLGNEFAGHSPVAVSRKTFRSRQSARRRRSELDEVVGALSRYRQRRHPLSHAARNEPSQRRIFYAGNRSRRSKRATQRTPQVWQRNLDRLNRKHETARTAVPAPAVEEKGHKIAILAYGTTHHAVVEAIDRLLRSGDRGGLLARACPAALTRGRYVRQAPRGASTSCRTEPRRTISHGILRAELPTYLIGRLESIRHYNGVPIDAHVIIDPLLEAEREPAVIAE